MFTISVLQISLWITVSSKNKSLRPTKKSKGYFEFLKCQWVYYTTHGSKAVSDHWRSHTENWCPQSASASTSWTSAFMSDKNDMIDWYSVVSLRKWQMRSGLVLQQSSNRKNFRWVKRTLAPKKAMLSVIHTVYTMYCTIGNRKAVMPARSGRCKTCLQGNPLNGSVVLSNKNQPIDQWVDWTFNRKTCTMQHWTGKKLDQ